MWWAEIILLPDTLSQYFLLSTVEFWEKDTGSDVLNTNAKVKDLLDLAPHIHSHFPAWPSHLRQYFEVKPSEK